MPITLTAENGDLLLRFPYHAGLVASVKSLPTSDRRWDGTKKAWIISADAVDQLVDMIETHAGYRIHVPALRVATTETRIITVIYLGRCKERNGERSAFAMTASQSNQYLFEQYEWNVLFPEDTLREWFEAGDISPSEQSNLFSVLGVTQNATPDAIKSGYRHMVKQWHPDVNRNDPDAAEQFMRIQRAYEILSIDASRERYIAGLALQESIRNSSQAGQSNYRYGQSGFEYRAPLRCGYVMAEGIQKTGRFVVSKILAWEDIYNNQGEMMVVSWASGASEPVISWV